MATENKHDSVFFYREMRDSITALDGKLRKNPDYPKTHTADFDNDLHNIACLACHTRVELHKEIDDPTIGIVGDCPSVRAQILKRFAENREAENVSEQQQENSFI